MSSSTDKTIRLKPRDYEILKDVAAHHCVTVEALHRRFYDEKSVGAVKATLGRLCGKKPNYHYLQPEPLDERRVYYRLTLRGTKLLGVSPKLARPLGSQALLARLAILWFTHLSDAKTERDLFNPHHCEDVFPVHGHQLPRCTFYLQSQGETTKVGILVVDHGAKEAGQTVHKTIRVLKRCLKRHWFDDYIRAKCFLVTVLTVSEQKRNAIVHQLVPKMVQQLRHELTELQVRLGEHMEVEVVAVPGLQPLLFGVDMERKQ